MASPLLILMIGLGTFAAPVLGGIYLLSPAAPVKEADAVAVVHEHAPSVVKMVEESRESERVAAPAFFSVETGAAIAVNADKNSKELLNEPPVTGLLVPAMPFMQPVSKTIAPPRIPPEHDAAAMQPAVTPDARVEAPPKKAKPSPAPSATVASKPKRERKEARQRPEDRGFSQDVRGVRVGRQRERAIVENHPLPRPERGSLFGIFFDR